MSKLIYTIQVKNHNKTDLLNILSEHPEIKFVSFVGVDLSGNDTDEKIPVKIFIEDIDTFLTGVAIQTDGSSVVLPGIATLNDAKVDMIADLNANWFVDYNYDFLDSESNKPVGTLRIPSFLFHNNKPVCSRHILNSAIETFKTNLWDIFKTKPAVLAAYGISITDIEEIVITSASELEFWVKTPNDTAKLEELYTSEVLHEHYWTRTKGSVRTALEQTLLLMDDYGFEPEMGHKEVGGVKAKLQSSGQFNHIMEQLEIDWKYSNAIQAADNEIFIKTLTQETFRRNGLDVTFMAKPLDGVAGSGMHIHLGVSLKLTNGKRINLFHATKEDFISCLGYGAIMGLLHNYEVMNPFISSTNNSLKRLKPGFEAPICIVTSLGLSPDNPSRNRTILIGLIRDLQNPLATRFELRSPNPHTNIYLAIAVSYMAMLDGILYAVDNKTEAELLTELSKAPGEFYGYLEKSRAYRTEKDVFEDFSEEERNEYFGIAPATIYENITQLDTYKDKLECLKRNGVLDDKIINSFKLATMQRWSTEIGNRVISSYANEIRGFKMLHNTHALDLDVSNWMQIDSLRKEIMKDTYTQESLFTKIRTALNSDNYELASKLYLELEDKMSTLKTTYTNYKRNLLDI